MAAAGDLHVTLDGTGDLTTQLYRGLREAVRDGRLRPGDRLPPSRELATRLQVSRGTVSEAYERLVAEGFLTARVGSGTFVADDVPEFRATERRRPGAVRPRASFDVLPAPTTTDDEVRYDFRVGTPDPTLFPFDTWRRLVAAELREGANAPARYGDPAGLPSLREAIARYIGVSRSVRCDPEDVVVTSGAQHALDLLTRVVLEPGDVVAVEEPGYPPAATLFAASGMRVVPVPVDDEGLRAELLPARARLVYTTPSHQFPLGVTMSLRRRVALMEWAEAHGALVVEDDFDSEFRFTARPLEPLTNLDRRGRVCYIGSFSKTMLPSLRLGFVVAPPSLRAGLRAARQLSDGFSPTATQAALARFIDEGMLARHVRKAAGVYASRHQQVQESLDSVPGVRVVPAVAGLHVCARFPGAPAGTSHRVLAAAARTGVAADSLAAYHRQPAVQGDGSAGSPTVTLPADPVGPADPPGSAGSAGTEDPEGREGVAVGYGAVRSDDVAEGLRRLVRVLRRELQRS